MLIICEDCAKRYNIDESRIKGNRARFTCKECRHIIIVNKSDVSRRLIAVSNGQETKTGDTGNTGNYDLLREMEETQDSVTPSSVQDQDIGNDDKEKATLGKKITFKDSVQVYFLLAFLAAFFCSSGVLAYLYLGPIAGSLQNTDVSPGFLSSALLVLGICWGIVLIIFFILASLVSRPLNKLKKDFTRLANGEQGVILSPKGPMEVRELADVLARNIHPQQ